MKYAISTDGPDVSMHFGRCPQFTLVEIENGKLINKQVIDNPGHHPGFLPGFLSQKGVNSIIAGGMGHKAMNLFEQANINVILGITGKVENVIKDIVTGELKGGETLCEPGKGKGYGIDKTICEHEE